MAEETDYDKQYKEDLERAQALSLESLALEQFKNKRLQELNKAPIKNKNISVLRASSMTETDSNHVNKSRPRPGTSSGSLNSSLIAPPPSSQRKNSTTSFDSPDLISFCNPPTSADNIIEFCNLQSYGNNAITTFSNPATMLQHYTSFRPQMTSFIPNNSSYTIQQQQQQQQQASPAAWFQQSVDFRSPTNSGRNVLGHHHHHQTQQQAIVQVPTSLTPPSVPALPPKNQKSTPPPLSVSSSSSSSTSNSKTRLIKKHSGPNLIDLVQLDDKNSVRVSILQEFDPILSSPLRSASPNCSGDDAVSVCGSVYDEYDPYDIYTGSGNNSLADPVYAAVVKSENAPQSPAPPLPPRVHNMATLERNNSRNMKDKKLDLLDTILRVTKNAELKDIDLRAFFKMVYNVRNRYKYSDANTNMGLVISPMVNCQYRDGTSIKLCVYPDFEGADVTKPVNFTCDVNSSVEHVTLQLTCGLEAPAKDKYTLKVWGCNEYLVPTTFLSDYEYVHNCIKLDEDVVLNLIPDSKVDKSFARTKVDDNREKHLSFESIIPNETVSHISYDNLLILLETIEKEMKKLENEALQNDSCNNPSSMPAFQPQRVIQSVKCVVNLMGQLCTLEIMEAINYLHKICKEFERDCSNFAEIISSTCNRIRSAVESLLEMYCQTYDVDFVVKKSLLDEAEPIRLVPDIVDELLVRVCAVYRPAGDWKHDAFTIAAQIFHGSKPIGHPVVSPQCKKTDQDQLWPSRIVVDHWFEMNNVPINSLARESRLVLVIYGRVIDTSDGSGGGGGGGSGGNNSGSDNGGQLKYKQEIVGWASFQFFNYEGEMAQGNMILSIWPPETPFIQGPSPAAGTHPVPDHPMLDIQIPRTGRASFPDQRVPQEYTRNVQKGDFSSLDNQTQRQLLDICEQDMLYKLAPDLREVLWEKRHYLHHIPEALPKVLLAAHSWEYACLPDLHGMVHAWRPLKPIQALELLLPIFPDLELRKKAINWIRGFTNDELIDFIPQLVVALKHETYETSPLAQFLLDSALRSPRFAHHLFWLLSHTLPGSVPQNSSPADPTAPSLDIAAINEVRYHRRMKLMLRALLAICGEALQTCFLSQQVLVKDLNEIAEKVKEAKESHRDTVLHNALAGVHANLSETPTSLPLSPTLRVAGVQVRSCSYFPSNTLPLKISFLAPDRSVIPAIYKVGDDLQQDMLTLQVVRLMDKLWLNNGLDLKMVSFACVPTGKRKGMIEMVTNAETLRKIQMEHGLTGSFKDKPIAEWLAKHNPSELEYSRAVENFTASCAGYCVVTYILGICDRHNDNIMLKTSGHLFHIDFGKFLGDAQMFGNFKRDRTPFVLTSDMAYVINGGDRPTEKFHKFVDLCCQAFNIVRNSSNLFLCLFTMMFQGGNSGMIAESVSYLHNALLPTLSNPEAAAYFARLIESSMKSWFTQVNFFLHNLAQMKFSSDHNNEDSLLSFVPKTYTIDSDGKLTHVEVINFLKRYDPDKYYVYVLRVFREDNASPMEIQRTYKEFCELHQKLCMCFPLAKLHSLSTGLHVGRSNIKQVAEKRFGDVGEFIKSLFACAVEIAHSNLVYTFFHPLLRDQQDHEEAFSKKSKEQQRKLAIKNDFGRLKGQLKLSFQYAKNVFRVMVYHLRNLPLLASGQEPSTYVKVYLLPDPRKTTKRKTKVVKRNCHPSFVEMLEYRMGAEIIRERRLRATVWNYDSLQENEFLGGVELEMSQFDLGKETVEWYPLVNLPG